MYSIPWLLRDGVVLPLGEPLQQLAGGNFHRVPVILGSNRDVFAYRFDWDETPTRGLEH